MRKAVNLAILKSWSIGGMQTDTHLPAITPVLQYSNTPFLNENSVWKNHHLS